jgi:serpin B
MRTEANRMAAAALLTAMAGAFGCSSSPSDPIPPRAFTADEQGVSDASTSFGLDLFARVSAASAEPNVMVSPLSVSMALGMAANGANGETLDAIRSVLGFAGLDEASVNEAYRGLIEQLRARDPGIEFRLANSVWYQQGFPVLDPFLDAARTYFDAAVEPLDFSAPGAPGTISAWAENATNGRIKDLIKSIDANEVMFLVNAVYFKAPWTTPFHKDATRDDTFTRANGSTVMTPMMTVDAARPFVSNTEIEAVELLYGDSAFSMVVVMPAQGRSLGGLIDSLSPEKWDSWMSDLSNGRVMLTMPKFRFDFGKRLNDALRDAGMGIAFIPYQADFDRIAVLDPEELYISRVEHKTFIAVDEDGTEAAAATAVGIGVTSLPPSIRIDRPFLFAIRERSLGTLLFVGRVGDPTFEGEG